MRIAHTLRIFPAVLAAAFAMGTAAQEPPLPTAREIVDRVIARARQVDDQKLLQQYDYQLRFVVERLDGSGQVTSRDEHVYQPVRVDGARFSRLVARNGKPLSGKELEQEAKREREFRKRLAEERKKKPAEREVFRFDEHLVEKYRAEVLGRETVAGRDAWVLRFEPKGRNLPSRGRYERLLNHVAGKIWVDVADAAIVRAEGRLLEPVKWGWGLVASIHTLDFTVEQMRMDDGVWLPKELHTYVQGRIIFSGVHQRQQSTWTDFRKEPPGAPGASR